MILFIKGGYMNNLVLAYLGDAVYELWIREYLINKGLNKVNDLQIESMKYVSAKSCARVHKKTYFLNHSVLIFNSVYLY